MSAWEQPLRSWLRKAPKPARLRVRTVDGEERMVEFTADVRGRWKAAEEAVLAMRAESVECLDANGATLRAMRLEVDGGDDADSASVNVDKAVERAVSRRTAELAGVLDAYGKRLNDSFAMGANAANTGQEHLANLVETLSTNLATAIVNVHNMAVSLANVLVDQADQQGKDGGSKNEEMLGMLLGGMAAKAVGGGRPAAAAPPSNGKRGDK